jgi:heme-degrading monooxygenase HmoA
VIARVWRGWTRAEDADRYVEYLQQTGLAAFRSTAGNEGSYVLRRTEGATTEFIVLSFWESDEAVQRFAGEDIDRAVFYPEDERFLVARDEHVTHYELIPSD